MLNSLRLQFFYSLTGLFLFGSFVWLLFLFHGPEDITALRKITYFELDQKLTFPVKPVPQSSFNLIRLAYPVLLILFTAFSLAFFRDAFFRMPGKFSLLFKKIIRFMKSELGSLNRTERIVAGLTFILIITERFYYLFQFPIHTDEAASYFLFIQNGIWATATFYPIPNNHLLQNLLASALTPFFSEPFWILRLPPLLFSLLLTFSGFLITRRFSDFTTAYLASGLFGFSCFTLFMATQGRGYMLLTLLAVLAFASIMRALQTGKAGYWSIFSLLSVLGFYTVPTFLYPFAVCVFVAGIYILFQKQWQKIPKMTLAGATVLSGTLLLYMPLLLVSGPEALFGNKYLRRLTPEQFWEQLPLYLRESQGFLMGGKFGGGILFFYVTMGALLALFLFRNRPFLKKQLPKHSNWLIGFALATSLVVYAFMRFQLMLPPPRVLFFKSFFDYLGAALIIGFLLKFLIRNNNLRVPLMLFGVLIFAGFQVLAAEFFLKDYPQPYYNFPALVKQIQKSEAKKVYVEEPFYQLFLEYEYARFGKKIQIDNVAPVASEKYDYVMIELQKKFPENIADSLYQEVYKDELVRAYVPKK
ncbi:glycosyltransferase family 39 protein [Adhaeribacter sp. BT258]|uniref:Glycosyltransferase family 39 protein n=1 Tax=Adhaeribacter terrigena TaxID=2793070 RepID=A0ABS1BXW1_9BACT|nr:glycosyltransferase family 39 protein [Adhaeribacter terrigena]MBK0401934.1 glycosyltransferase family 39 protein [Adhaeribacter terrigena]